MEKVSETPLEKQFTNYPIKCSILLYIVAVHYLALAEWIADCYASAIGTAEKTLIG